MPNGLKEWAETIANLVTVLALILGGVWAFFHFRLWRQKWPRAVLAHSVSSHLVPEAIQVLRVMVAITNVGGVLLRLKDGLVRVQQMQPWPVHLLESGTSLITQGCADEMEYPWPLLIERQFNKMGFELEPNETEEFCFDFFLRPEVRAVIIYTYVGNVTKRRSWWQRLLGRRDIGWQKTSMCELQPKGDENGPTRREDHTRPNAEHREEAGARQTEPTEAARASEVTTAVPTPSDESMTGLSEVDPEACD